MRSGDAIALGDTMTVVIDDVAILRRTVYGRRVGAEAWIDPRGTRKRGTKGKHAEAGRGARGHDRHATGASSGGRDGHTGRGRDERGKSKGAEHGSSVHPAKGHKAKPIKQGAGKAKSSGRPAARIKTHRSDGAKLRANKGKTKPGKRR
jgi:ribonuclease R